MRRILITEDAHRNLLEMAAAAHPNETGGVVLGVRASRTVWIATAVELAGDSGRSHYVVPRNATGPVVAQARSVDPRMGYLGDWHSHTDDTGPSSTDRATMRTMAWFLQRPPPGGPLMVLVRFIGDQHDINVYSARFPFLRPANIVLTGPLPRCPHLSSPPGEKHQPKSQTN